MQIRERLERARTWVGVFFGTEMRPVTVASPVWQFGAWGQQEELTQMLVQTLQVAALDTGCQINENYQPLSLPDPEAYAHIIKIDPGTNKNANDYMRGLTQINLNIQTVLNSIPIDPEAPSEAVKQFNRLLIEAQTNLTSRTDSL